MRGQQIITKALLEKDLNWRNCLLLL